MMELLENGRAMSYNITSPFGFISVMVEKKKGKKDGKKDRHR